MYIYNYKDILGENNIRTISIQLQAHSRVLATKKDIIQYNQNNNEKSHT
jgi:hypothetical protein